MPKLSPVIKGRTVFLLSHGASIAQLEQTIHEYKDKDICWMGMGLFTNMEKYILSKIDKQLDIVFDCASVPEGFRYNYETNVRMPRLAEFCDRKVDNCWVTTHGIIRDCVTQYAPEMLRFNHKILQIDDFFPRHQIGMWMDVPNSTTLAIATALLGRCSKLFIFGMDGYTGDVATGVSTYYHPEEHQIERMAALGSIEDPGINRDTDAFAKRFPAILRNYQRLFGNFAPVYNVSPKTLYTVPQKIQYEQVKGLL